MSKRKEVGESDPGPSAIVGVGVDLVQIERIQALITRHGTRARRRLFTDDELATCDRHRSPAECLAARFAAKEAVLKALGTGKTPEIRWTDLEVEQDAGGRPSLRFRGAALERKQALGVSRAWVSLSHEAGTACALVVLEGAAAR